MKRRLAALVAVFMFVLSLAGCGTNNSGTDHPDVARLRFLNASPNASNVDLLIDGLQVLSNIEYTQSSSYFDVSEGNRRLKAVTADNNLAFDVTEQLKNGDDYTLIATNVLGNIQPLFIKDENTLPASRDFSFRFINASPAAGNVDVYLFRPGTALSDTIPILKNQPFQEISDYRTFGSKDLIIQITRAGTLDVLVDTGTIPFGSEQVRTAVLVDAPGGGAPFRVLLLADRDAAIL